MSIIEQAAKRLEELRRAGVDVPWAAAGLSEAEYEQLTRNGQPQGEGGAAPLPAPGPTRGGPRLVQAPPTAAPVDPVQADQPVEAEPAPGGRRSREVTLDLGYLAAANFLVPDSPRTALADEFRVIKRPLIRNAQGEGAAPVARGNLICVTSALPGEGKTFCAINLALSIAMEVDKTVLLVDADVVRPSVMHRLGIDADKGLLDLLTQPDVELPDVLLRTNVPKLTLLPSGTARSNSTELLASAAMELLLDELATKYSDRIIVFDGPPLLATTESRVLAARAGQVVMVVESGKTTHGAVAQAFATVESCPVVMSVLNKFHGQGGSYRYGYYGY